MEEWQAEIDDNYHQEQVEECNEELSQEPKDQLLLGAVDEGILTTVLASSHGPKRAPAFHVAETRILLTCVNKSKQVIENIHFGAVFNARKKGAWELIEEEYDETRAQQDYSYNRTESQLKYHWQPYKYKISDFHSEACELNSPIGANEELVMLILIVGGVLKSLFEPSNPP
ncbi:hypothetical protein QAD02_005396 [Eretmocerus hayati]|uniref:Uncharacterized protein n=1 Tax=Eretmocerus hayati TaxID=131215 RepID=A0ACC2NV17_9HYME|nr:hypothetical protein QAD02_005396 [Eretmocerus hayati]